MGGLLGGSDFEIAAIAGTERGFGVSAAGFEQC